MIAKDSHRPHRFPARMTAGLIPALVLAVMCLWNNPAAADFRLCNNTSSRVGIALGCKDAEGWTTEGWWNVSSRACETLLRGTLVARFYYIYALDYDRGGEWSGQAFMCSRDKEFTIKGTENCLARGFERSGCREFPERSVRAAPATFRACPIRPACPIRRAVRPRARLVCRRRPEASHETPAPYQNSRNAWSCILRQRDDPAAVR